MTAERSLQAGCCRKILAVEWPLEPRPIDRLSTGWKSAALRNRPFTYGREPLQQCSAVTSDSLWLLSSAANWHSRPDSVSTLPCQEAARRRSGPAGPDGVEAQRSRVVDLDSDVVSGRLQPMEWPSSSCTAPILRAPADQRRIGSPHRVRREVRRVEAKFLDPAFEDSGVRRAPKCGDSASGSRSVHLWCRQGIGVFYVDPTKALKRSGSSPPSATKPGSLPG